MSIFHQYFIRPSTEMIILDFLRAELIQRENLIYDMDHSHLPAPHLKDFANDIFDDIAFSKTNTRIFRYMGHLHVLYIRKRILDLNYQMAEHITRKTDRGLCRLEKWRKRH